MPDAATQSITEIVGTFIRERFLYDRPDVQLTPDLPLIEQRLIDSLQLMQLVEFLQEQFGIFIDVMDLVVENFTSINTIATFVQKQKNGTGSENGMPKSAALQLYDFHPESSLGCDRILAMLELPAKELTDELLYSKQGSEYFEAVTQTKGYYLARTEIAIMEAHVSEMAECIGPDALLVEYGSGSSRKTRLILDAMPGLAGYAPIDISREFLLSSAEQIAADYPRLEVLPVCADFQQVFELPAPRQAFGRRVGYLSGSTIGNRSQQEAGRFLAKIRRDMGQHGGLLIAVDLKKDPQIFTNAYNANEAACIAFVKSALTSLNDSFGGNFDLGQFRFQSFYNEEKCRVEICLISLEDQTVQVCGHPIVFAAGEKILVHVACKYTLAEFAALAREAGWEVRKVWTDPRQYLSMQYLESI